MSAARLAEGAFAFGTPLTSADYESLARCYISPEIAHSARLRRVTSCEGKQIVGQSGFEDFAGIVFPYYWPGEPHSCAHRLRRDNPPIAVKQGIRKEDRKYLSPPGWGNRFYFHPDTPASVLADVSIPFAITEGQKKCLALFRLVQEGSAIFHKPMFVPIGLNGVWGFRGIRGKVQNARGERVSEKGVIADLDRIAWGGRCVYIVFDANIHTNEEVAAARKELAYELQERGARVMFVNLPVEDGVNGIDDLLGKHGAGAALKLFDRAEPYDCHRDETNVKEIADEITATAAFTKDAGGKLYIFEGGVYKPTGERSILSRIKALLIAWRLAHTWTSRKGKEVCEYIRVDAPQLWDKPPCDIVNVANGLLNLRTKKLEAHSPDHLSPIQLPVIYDPDARCPKWDRFISEVFPSDSEAIAWEIPAWLMTPDTSIQQGILLMGDGANGKSTYLRAVLAFIGHHNVAPISLHRLENDRFSIARLVGKLANICPDLPSDDLSSSSIFKAITGGDVLQAERKFEESFDFVPFARLIFSANHLPKSQDASPAFFRRWVVVPFERTFHAGDAGTLPRDQLDAMLADPAELSGVLNKAIEALASIRANGLSQSESTLHALEEFRLSTDPVAVWLDRNTVLEPDALIPADRLWQDYNQDCEAKCRPIVSKTALGRALTRLRPTVEKRQRTINGKLAWCYVGIGSIAEEFK